MNAQYGHMREWMMAVVVLLLAVETNGATRYVSPGGGNVAPYTSWPNAARTITAAVAYAVANDVILISNGTYQVTQSILLGKPLTIRGVNGPAATILDGLDGDVYFGSATDPQFISGLTFTRFRPRGGVFDLLWGGAISNCILKNNHAMPVEWPLRVSTHGGILLYDSAIADGCLIVSNVFDSGVVSNGLRISRRGSPIESWGGKVRNCTIAHNTSAGDGGGGRAQESGLSASTLENCLIHHNSSSGRGGGVYLGTGSSMTNCTLANNVASQGGGVHFSASSGPVVNSIIYDNSPQNWSSDAGALARYSCTTPALPGVSNITDNPIFRDPRSANFRLHPSSPCIDHGTNATASLTDLEGGPRVLDGDGDGIVTVDMGCYEFWQASLENGGAEPNIRWPAAGGYTAHVEHCTDLISGVFTQYMVIPCVPPSGTVTVSLPGFYRVILSRP